MPDFATPAPAAPAAGNGGVPLFPRQAWLGQMRSAHPELTAGKSNADILALRSDPVLAREMTERHAAANTAALTAQGLPATPGNLYLAQRIGAPGAAGLLTADPAAPANSAAPAAASANPDLFYAPGPDGAPDPTQPKTAAAVVNDAATAMGGTQTTDWNRVLDAVPASTKVAIAADGQAALIRQATDARNAAGATQRAAFNTARNGIADGSFGLADLDAATQNGAVPSPGDRRALLGMIGARNQQGLALAGTTAQVADPSHRFDPFSPADRDAVDLWYRHATAQTGASGGGAGAGGGLIDPPQTNPLSALGLGGQGAAPAAGLDTAGKLLWAVDRTGIVPASAASLIQTGIHAADPATRQQALTVMDAVNRTNPAAAARAFTSADRKRLDIFHALAPVASPDALEAELGLPDAKAIAAKQTLAAEGKKQAQAVTPGEIIFGAFGPGQDPAVASHGAGALPPPPAPVGATLGTAVANGTAAGPAAGATGAATATDAAAAAAGGDPSAAGGAGQAAPAAAPAAAGQHSAATAAPAGAPHALPALPPVPGVAAALQGDFADNYGEAFAAVRRPDPARKLAMGWIAHTWGPTNSGSPANTIAQYPPEQYFPAQPAPAGDGAAATPVNGADHSWLHDRLAASVQQYAPGATQFGVLPVPGRTAAEVAAGQPPSYQVWYRDNAGNVRIAGAGADGPPLTVTFSQDAPQSPVGMDPTRGGLIRQVSNKGLPGQFVGEPANDNFDAWEKGQQREFDEDMPRVTPQPLGGPYDREGDFTGYKPGVPPGVFDDLAPANDNEPGASSASTPGTTVSGGGRGAGGGGGGRNLAPGFLNGEEGGVRGGHTLFKHVAKDNTFLANRITKEDKRVVSTFVDQNEAEKYVSLVLNDPNNVALLDKIVIAAKPGSFTDLSDDFPGELIGRVAYLGPGGKIEYEPGGSKVTVRVGYNPATKTYQIISAFISRKEAIP